MPDPEKLEGICTEVEKLNIGPEDAIIIDLFSNTVWVEMKRVCRGNAINRPAVIKFRVIWLLPPLNVMKGKLKMANELLSSASAGKLTLPHPQKCRGALLRP